MKKEIIFTIWAIIGVLNMGMLIVEKKYSYAINYFFCWACLLLYIWF